MHTLRENLRDYVAGCFTGIWIQTHEPQEAIAEIGKLCQEQSWQFATWNIDQGLRLSGNVQLDATEAADPLAAVKCAASLSTAEIESSLLVLENFHRFLGSAEIVQALASQIHAGKVSRSFVIILAPLVDLPPELEKLFVVIEHELPDREQLLQIAGEIATGENELPEDAELQTVLDAAGGLTRYEAESAFSLSIVRDGRIDAKTIWELKSGMLKKSGLLELYEGNASFDSLGGMNAMKSFCQTALSRRANSSIHPRGLMLLSPPGCGKSEFCKALGRETGRPVIRLDVGSLLGSLVGQTEHRTRQALRIIDAMQPAICWIDELDKAFAGVGGSGAGDSGVSSRMFGSFLSWLNDHESDVFVVCTANDVTKLPPEFARAERFDAVYFLDLPSSEEKEAIWQIYLDAYEIDPQQKRPDDTSWSGAEIKACCRLAVLLDEPILNSADKVVPVAVTSSESITRLREWAVAVVAVSMQRPVRSTRQQNKLVAERSERSAPLLPTIELRRLLFVAYTQSVFQARLRIV